MEEDNLGGNSLTDANGDEFSRRRGSQINEEMAAPVFNEVGGGAGSIVSFPTTTSPTDASNLPITYTYSLTNRGGTTIVVSYQTGNGTYKQVDVTGFLTRQVCAIPNSFSGAIRTTDDQNGGEFVLVEQAGTTPCTAVDGSTPSTPGGSTQPVDSNGVIDGTTNQDGTFTPTVSTKFNLRIINTNGAVAKYVIGGRECLSGTTYEFDKNDFQKSVDIIPNYNTNLYNLKNSFRIYTQPSGTLFVYEKKKNTSRESERNFSEFPVDIQITFDYESLASKPIEDTEIGVVVTLVGPSDSAIATINNDTVISLKSGENILPTKLQDSVSIKNTSNNFRVSSISVAGITESKIVEAQTPTETVSTNFNVTGTFRVTVTAESFQQITFENIPFVAFVNGSNRDYNTNSNAGVAFTLAKGNGTNRIRANVGGKEYSFSNLADGDVILPIPAEAFPSPGQYKIFFTPSNNFGDGNPIEGNVNCFADIYVDVPDIRDIVYPSVLRGPDYVGTNVDFEVSYKSVNADYVRIYKLGSTQFIQGPSSGTVKLNVQQILDLDNTISSEDEDKIRITLKIIPYNISGYQVVTGKEEFVTIDFDKGDLIIPREVAINRIGHAFVSQFDTSVFNDETSKYLTHLLHFGSGDNKVITTWVGDRGSLIAKLYEPLPTSFQVNQKVWISKLQSNPIIETITLTGDSEGYCPPLKGPNFNVSTDSGVGFKVYNDLIASGSTTSNDIVLKYLEGNGIDTSKLNVQYVSDSTYAFNNFVNFSSAEERVNNFYYKLEVIENYNNKRDLLIASGSSLYNKTESDSISNSINELVRGFDGFEKWLYTDTEYMDSLSYPKILVTNPITGISKYEVKPINDSESVAWYDSIVVLASEYDKYNPNYLSNNIPQFIKEDYDNNDFIVFLDMIGQHFDIIWVYINNLKGNKVLEEKQIAGATNNLIYYLLESMGWEGKRAFDSQFLWEYAFGTNKDGSQKYSMSLEDANNQVWRRILNNLPYLLKHKGTARAMKAVMACYGVPQSMLTIMEFGGPQDPTTNGTTKFTYDDRTAAIQLKSGSFISIPWKSSPTNGMYPQAIEFRLQPTNVENSTILKAPQFSLDIIKTTGSFAKLELKLNSGTSGSTNQFPLSTKYYSNVLVNKSIYNGSANLYEVTLKTSDGTTITNSVSMSFTGSNSDWEIGSNLVIGDTLNGNVDEVRLWQLPLDVSKFENHTLEPNAINGNSYTSSTADLLFRLDFEYPKDRIIDPYIKNVAINDLYGANYATASNMYSAEDYPYQYIPYDRTVTATVPSLGFNYSNKIRYEEQELIGDLSHKVRATKKTFDRTSIDSNRLGIFMSPIKELNMDIVRAFGDFNIDNYIGDPSDDYKTEYKELADLRKYYFQRLNRNIYEYIQLVRYIDKSLFDVLGDLAPARAKVSKGLLIEPHYLERSKTKWDKPISEKGDYETVIVVSDTNVIESTYDVENVILDTRDTTNIISEAKSYNAEINTDDTYILDVNLPSFDTSIDNTETTLIDSNYPTYPPTGSVDIDCNLGSNLLAEVDSFTTTTVGIDPNSIANSGFGLYAEKGTGVVSTIESVFGNYQTTGSRQSIFLVKQQTSKKIYTQTAGWPATNIPGEQVSYSNIEVVDYKYRITKLPFSGSVSVGNDVVSVTALDGYFPSHYRYTNNLSEGLQRSYWKGSIQSAATTPDGLDVVEVFTTNPNILKVANTGRGSGQPILIVE